MKNVQKKLCADSVHKRHATKHTLILFPFHRFLCLGRLPSYNTDNTDF